MPDPKEFIVIVEGDQMLEGTVFMGEDLLRLAIETAITAGDVDDQDPETSLEIYEVKQRKFGVTMSPSFTLK